MNDPALPPSEGEASGPHSQSSGGEAFGPLPPPLTEVLLALRLGWERGDPPTIEQLLARHPHLAGDPDAILDLIYQEVVLREGAGQKPRLADYAGRFPELADALRLQFEVDEALTVEGQQTPASTLPATLSPEGMEDLPKLEGVDLLDELGRGAMGVVYRGWQRGAKRPVAVKVLSGEMPAGRARNEVEAATRLSHPHIVTVHEVKDLGGRVALVLEYVEGGNLAEKLSGKPQPPRDAAHFIEQVAWAMAYAHGRGVIHRDLKPSNILLSGGPDAPLAQCQPRIGDFGLAKLVEQSAHLTKTNDVLGTPSYMAPEQAVSAGQVGPAADIYALGAVLYEMLTGRPPFLGQNLLDTLDQVRRLDPVPPSQLQASCPRDLEVICLKCLHKDPARRYAGARDLAEDLRRFLAGEPIKARPVGWAEWAWKWAKRRPVAAALALFSAAAAVALLAGGYVVAGVQRRQADAALKLAGQLEERLQQSRQLLYTAQLLRIGAMVNTGPAQGLRMLESEELCPPGLRCFSWGVLHRLCRPYRHVAMLTRPSAGLALTPDGAHAVAGGADGLLTVWSPAGARVAGWRVPGGAVTALAAADGLAAAATADGRVSLWALPGGEARGSFATGSGPAAGLAFGPEGRWLAVNAGKANAAVVLWDTRTLRVRRSLRGDTDPACRVAVSPDGARVACAALDESILVWDVLTGRLAAEMRGHSAPVRCVAFGPGGRQVVSGSIDGTARVWDVARGVEVDAAMGAVGPVTSVTFTPDGLQLVLTGEGHGDDEMPADVQIWDLAQRKGQEPMRAHRGASAVLFAPGGKAMLTTGADRTVKWWDHPGPVRMRALAGHTGAAGTVSMTPDGKSLAWVTTPARLGPDEVTVIDVATGAVGPPLRGGQRSIRLVALVPGGRLAVTAGGAADEPAEVFVWDLGKGKDVWVLSGHAGVCSALAVSADGKRLATAADDGVRLWDLESGRELWKRPGKFMALAFGGGLLAAVGAELRAWTLEGEDAGRADVPAGMACLAFTGDLAAVAGGEEGVVRLVSLKTGEASILDVGMNDVAHVAFSADGKTLAAAGSASAVKLWDVASRQERAALAPHRGGSCFVAFRSDGVALLTASRTGLARLWYRAE